jgi:hypothetical protein
VKLSGSLKMCGSFRFSTVNIMMVIANPKICLYCKVGVEWDFISVFA